MGGPPSMDSVAVMLNLIFSFNFAFSCFFALIPWATPVTVGMDARTSSPMTMSSVVSRLGLWASAPLSFRIIDDLPVLSDTTWRLGYKIRSLIDSPGRRDCSRYLRVSMCSRTVSPLNSQGRGESQAASRKLGTHHGVLCIKEGPFFRHLFPGSSLTVPTHLKLTLPSTVKLHPGYDFTARMVG